MKKHLNIGITCYPSIGGSGIVATELGIGLAKLGHKVHFITYEKPFRLHGKNKNIYFHEVKVNEYELFRYPDYTLPLAVKMGEVAQKYNLDILHVHYAVPHATAALLANAVAYTCHHCRPRIITTLHGTDITLLARDPSLQSVIRFSIENSDGVTAVSQSLATETKQVLKTAHPIEVIYNFFEPKKPALSAAAIRKQLRVNPADFLLVHSSNLRGVKRIEDLLKILAKVPKEYPIKLLILSGGKFETYMPLAKKLKVDKKIIVQHKVREIENYLNASDAGIYTSETESFGMGILETMSYGKPVLATRAGGVPEVLRDKQDGFLYKVGDIQAFANGIVKLHQDPGLVKKLGQNAKQQAQNKFSTNKIVSQYEAYYRNILRQ